MKVNFDKLFYDLDGRAISRKGPDGSAVEYTFGRLAADALVADVPSPDGGAPLNAEMKARRYHLAMRIVAGGSLDVTPEEAVLVKQAVGALYTSLIVGPAFDALNG